jgi:hypothetical protein
MMAAHVATVRHVPPRVSAAFALALALLPPAATSIGVGGARAFTIEGFIVDPEHRPIGGVIVSLEGTDRATTADSLGVFELRGVAPGTYALSVRGECTISGYVSRVQVPRPVKVPLPVTAYRVDCAGNAGDLLSEDQQATLVREALADAVRAEHRALADALLRDGAIHVVSPNVTAATFTLADGSRVPIQTEGAEGGGEIRIRVCLTTRDGRTVFVHLMRLGPPPPPELDVLLADRALLTFTRDEQGPWRTVHQLFCLSDSPARSAGGRD